VNHIAAEPIKSPIVNLGDSVDYLLSGYNKSLDNTINNRSLFYREIAKISADYYEVPGNHDHRLVAYNLRAWGLDHINVGQKLLKQHADQIGHVKLRSPLKELRAIMRLGYKVDPLEGFRGVLKPLFARIGGFDCILINTHGDGFLSIKKLTRIAFDMLTGIIYKKPSNPGIMGKGLNQADIKDISTAHEACGSGPVLHFMHVPLINPGTKADGQGVTLDINRLTTVLRRHNLDHHVMANGGGSLLKLLRKRALGISGPPKNIILIAGHTHNAVYFLIDADTLMARQVDVKAFNAAWHDTRFIKHATVLPLGVIDSQINTPRTGYAQIHDYGIEEITIRNFCSVGLHILQDTAIELQNYKYMKNFPTSVAETSHNQ